MGAGVRYAPHAQQVLHASFTHFFRFCHAALVSVGHQPLQLTTPVSGSLHEVGAGAGSAVVGATLEGAVGLNEGALLGTTGGAGVGVLVG